MTSPTTDRRLGLTGGAALKSPVKAATTANITLSSAQTIDGVSVVTGDRVLVKDQTTGADNGIYVVDTGAWSRDLDFDGAYDALTGTLIFCNSGGAANGSGLFVLSTTGTITIGTTSLTFTKIATLSGAAVTQAQVQNGQYVTVGTIAGTNTITGATLGAAPSAHVQGQYVFFVPANTNTGSVTFNRDGLGAKNIFYDGAALIGSELQANIGALLYYDGTQYQLIASACDSMNFSTRGTVASAATIVLDTANPYSQITGVVTITAITLGNGRVRFVEFAGSLTLTNGASLALPTGANVVTAAGDTAIFAGEAAGVVRCLSYTRASGSSLSSSSVLRSYLAGLTMSTAGSSSTMTIAAGQATDSANAASMTLASAMAKTTGAWVAGTGNGGIDTGAIANATWYHFYLINGSSGTDITFSLNATTPTLPAGYNSYYRRIGSGKTDGSAKWVLFTQDGDYFRWSASVKDVDTTNPGTSAVTATLASVPTGINVFALFNMAAWDTGGVGAVQTYVSPLEATDEAPSLTAAPFYNIAAGSNIPAAAYFSIRTNTSAQIRYRCTGSGAGTTARIATLGWIDYRGRNA